MKSNNNNNNCKSNYLELSKHSLQCFWGYLKYSRRNLVQEGPKTKKRLNKELDIFHSKEFLSYNQLFICNSKGNNCVNRWFYFTCGMSCLSIAISGVDDFFFVVVCWVSLLSSSPSSPFSFFSSPLLLSSFTCSIRFWTKPQSCKVSFFLSFFISLVEVRNKLFVLATL